MPTNLNLTRLQRKFGKMKEASSGEIVDFSKFNIEELLLTNVSDLTI